MNEKDDPSPRRTGKVARLIDKYGFDDLGDELVARWTAETDRMSLRALAKYFNKRLLESRLEEQRVETLAGEIDNLYELLTDDNVTSGTRIEAENRLRQNGVAIEELRADFVTRQAIHTYLTKHRKASYDGSEAGDIVERRLADLQRLKSRQQIVTEQTLSSLQSEDHLPLGEHRVHVSVQVQCVDCERQFEIAELLERGGCDCGDL
jgi:hypothetical protein